MIFLLLKLTTYHIEWQECKPRLKSSKTSFRIIECSYNLQHEYKWKWSFIIRYFEIDIRTKSNLKKTARNFYWNNETAGILHILKTTHNLSQKIILKVKQFLCVVNWWEEKGYIKKTAQSPEKGTIKIHHLTFHSFIMLLKITFWSWYFSSTYKDEHNGSRYKFMLKYLYYN